MNCLSIHLEALSPLFTQNIPVKMHSVWHVFCTPTQVQSYADEVPLVAVVRLRDFALKLVPVCGAVARHLGRCSPSMPIHEAQIARVLYWLMKWNYFQDGFDVFERWFSWTGLHETCCVRCQGQNGLAPWLWWGLNRILEAILAHAAQKEEPKYFLENILSLSSLTIFTIDF